MSTSTLDRYSNSSLKSEVFTTSAISQLFRQRSTATDSSVHTPLSVGQKGVTPQLDNVAKSQQTGGRKLVKKGDIVINSRSDRRGASGLSDRDGSVSLIYIVLKPNLEKINPEFAHHLIRSKGFQEEFYRFGTGIVADLWSTRYERMAQIRVPLPPMESQQRIADYLDRETAEIDAAVADLDRYVELLEKRRKLVVADAVTGTESVKLAHLVRFGNGQDWKQVADPLGQYPVYGSGGAFGRASAFLHDGVAVLFGRKGTVDRPIYVDEKFWTVDTMYYAVPNENRCLGKYLYYWATTIPYETISTDTALPSVTSMDLSQLYVPLPSLDEQQQIIEYLDRETEETFSLVADSVKLRDLLLKRRSVLITEVVTGRKQV